MRVHNSVGNRVPENKETHLAHRHRQKLGVHARVQVQDVKDLHLGLLFRSESRVALLPQELAGTDERGGVLELPSHDVCPLVEAQEQVSVASDPLSSPITAITRFQSEDQVCISTTLRELDKSVLTQTCSREIQSKLSNEVLHAKCS
jgi:hypothetical protein